MGRNRIYYSQNQQTRSLVPLNNSEFNITLKVDLNIQSKNSKCEGLLALKKFPCLRKFLFGCTGQKFTKLKYGSMCQIQMPKLKIVGWDKKAFAAKEFKLADNVPNYYHDFLDLDCPLITISGHVPLKLKEVFTTADYLQKTKNLKILLPKLKRMHIKYDTEDVQVPDDIVAAAPNVQHLRLGETLTKLLNIKLDAIVKFSKKLNSFRSLQMLDAKHLKCTSKPLSSFTNSTSDGLLSRLLRAPQLEHVHVTGYSAQADELQSLIRNVRDGRILQKVRYCLMRGDCFTELHDECTHSLPQGELCQIVGYLSEKNNM